MTDSSEGDKPDTPHNDPDDEYAASSHGAGGGPIDQDASDTGDYTLRIPSDASEKQAAAIATAIAAYLEERERREEGNECGWDGDRWTFAGRLDGIRRRSRRVPSSAPRDAWTASGRSDLF